MYSIDQRAETYGTHATPGHSHLHAEALKFVVIDTLNDLIA